MGAQEDIARFQEIAGELGLDEKETQGFVDSAMKRKGYRQQTSWADPEPEDGGGEDGDFFSGRRQQREQRRVGGDSQRGSGGGSWQYGS